MSHKEQELYEANKRIFRERIDAAKAINIAHFLHDRYNYPVKKDGREFIVQTNSTAGKINVYRDRKSSNTWLYKSWGTGEAGNILQYLSRNELSGDLKQAATINKILNELNNYSPAPTTKNNFAPTYKSVANNNLDLSFLPHDSCNYLHSRGIDNSIIGHPKYVNCIYNKLFFPNPDKPFSFLNTAFPVTDFEGNIVDFSMKNRQYTKDGSYRTFSSYVAGGNKSKGVWISCTDEELIGEIGTFILAESELDALSYTKLKPRFLTGTLDISFGGHLSRYQYETIEKLYQKYKPVNVYLIADNDSNGNKYNIELLNFLMELSNRSTGQGQSPIILLKTDTPKAKDWNEVLMTDLGLSRKNIKANHNPFMGKTPEQVNDMKLLIKINKVLDGYSQACKSLTVDELNEEKLEKRGSSYSA